MSDSKGKLILSNEDVDVSNNRQEKKFFPFADLPSCLLEVIMCCLMLRDNIRASAVCKAWRKAAESVRVVEKHPWVITFPKRGRIVLFDPLEQKKYKLKLPELAGTFVLYSKDGWLLMRRSSLVDLFFFNPYTRELINLPKIEESFKDIAFSLAPTSGTCVVMALEPFTRYILRISICYLGATEWITEYFPCSLGFNPRLHSKLVYANGHFYCFSSGGVLVDFDLASRNVSHQAWNEHRCPYIHDGEWFNLPKRIYLTEQKGELFLMYTCSNEKPMVYKLVSSNWEEMNSTTLDGVTIFASRYSSETRLDVQGMRNSVYFPKYGFDVKGCLFYSFDEDSYRKQFPLITKFWQTQKVLCPLDSLWIEPPPMNILELMN